MTRVRHVRRGTAWAALPLLLLACGGDGTDPDPGTDAAAASSDEADRASGDGSAAADDDTGAGGAEPVADHLDVLEADALHDGVEPASPGTAYIELDGTRLEFDQVQCGIEEVDGGERLQLLATGDTVEGPADLRIQRRVGAEGYAFEGELVQLTLIGGTEERELNSITMVEHEREEPDSEPDWYSGGGPSPLVRLVGDDVTATGTVDRVPFAEDPIEGAFVAAANCG